MGEKPDWVVVMVVVTKTYAKDGGSALKLSYIEGLEKVYRAERGGGLSLNRRRRCCLLGRGDGVLG